MLVRTSRKGTGSRLSFFFVLVLSCIAHRAVSSIPPPPGARILDYLHARGEATDIVSPQPVKLVYLLHRFTSVETAVTDAVRQGYNVVLLSFYHGDGAVYASASWAALSETLKLDTIRYAHAHGAIVKLSLGGAEERPYAMDPDEYGRASADWANAQHLDGVDFDLENVNVGFQFTSANRSSVALIDWFVRASVAARDVLGEGRCGGLISHAPQAPYFGAIGNANSWAGPSGGFTAVYAALINATPPAIDWVIAQYYNQGPTCYNTYDAVFLNSSSGGCWAVGTSVSELGALGVHPHMVVLAKPLLPDDGGGSTSPYEMSSWTRRARVDLGWRAGVAAWSYDSAFGSAWLDALFPASAGSDAFAVGPDVAPVVGCDFPQRSSSQTATQSQSPTQRLFLAQTSPASSSTLWIAVGSSMGGLGGLLLVCLFVLACCCDSDERSAEDAHAHADDVGLKKGEPAGKVLPPNDALLGVDSSPPPPAAPPAVPQTPLRIVLAQLYESRVFVCIVLLLLAVWWWQSYWRRIYAYFVPPPPVVVTAPGPRDLSARQEFLRQQQEIIDRASAAAEEKKRLAAIEAAKASRLNPLHFDGLKKPGEPLQEGPALTRAELAADRLTKLLHQQEANDRGSAEFAEAARLVEIARLEEREARRAEAAAVAEAARAADSTIGTGSADTTLPAKALGADGLRSRHAASAPRVAVKPAVVASPLKPAALIEARNELARTRLPVEPASALPAPGGAEIVTLSVKCSDFRGTHQKTRRFYSTDTLRDLCDWVMLEIPGGMAGRQLVVLPRQPLITWTDYDLAHFTVAADFAAAAAEGYPPPPSTSVRGRRLADVGLSGRVALQLWPSDAPVASPSAS